MVTAEIRANTNLRIALRVTDAGESRRRDRRRRRRRSPRPTPAAPTCGSAPHSLVPFQSGPRRRASAGGDAGGAVRIAEMDWDDLPMLGRTGGPVDDVEDDVSVATDLADLVRAINDANAELGLSEMRKPWLPPLPRAPRCRRLGARGTRWSSSNPSRWWSSRKPSPWWSSSERSEWTDETSWPQDPCRSAASRRSRSASPTFPASSGRSSSRGTWSAGPHLMIAGQSRSGRSNCLRVLAGGIARQCSPEDVHLYGDRRGNNALLP